MERFDLVGFNAESVRVKTCESAVLRAEIKPDDFDRVTSDISPEKFSDGSKGAEAAFAA